MKYKILFLIMFTFSCNSQPIREEISVGSTIKIQATNFPTSDNSYTYKWSKPKGPEKNNFIYKIEKNKMLFTPNLAGDYDIILLIESFDKTLLYEEIFIYTAIDDGKGKQNDTLLTEEPIKINEKKNNNNISNKNEKEIKKSSYTIQVASWPLKEQAKDNQLQLKESGYDSYIEEYFVKSKDQTWWRVRVGHFVDKTKAELIKNQLSVLLKTELWIDFISQ